MYVVTHYEDQVHTQRRSEAQAEMRRIRAGRTVRDEARVVKLRTRLETALRSLGEAPLIGPWEAL